MPKATTVTSSLPREASGGQGHVGGGAHGQLLGVLF